MTSTNNSEKTVGILGGMGPEATVDLMQRIIANTPARDDVDHIRCLVDNDPKIPSRIQAILGNHDENPGPYLARMAKGLEAWGADFLVIPCNTAHAYYSYVAEAVHIPVVHLIDLVVDQVVREKGTAECVGILGSNTIVKTQLYTEKFAAVGMQVIYPDDDVQEQLFQIIRRVKKGETDGLILQELRTIARHLKAKGATTAILGCTELGIIAEDLPFLVIDAAEVLAQEVVAVAKNLKTPHIESPGLGKNISNS